MPQKSQTHLLIIGAGYSGSYIGKNFLKNGYRVSATTRHQDNFPALEKHGFNPLLIHQGSITNLPRDISHIVMTAPVSIETDHTSWSNLTAQITALQQLEWLCYLSTTGVYGDRAGALTNETTPLNPISDRARKRVAAEKKWQELSQRLQIPLDTLRLSGIYGLGRNILRNLIDGKSRIIIKDGQIFNRCHVQDVAEIAYLASLQKGEGCRIFNVSDDTACSPLEITSYAARLLEIPLPKQEPFETADLSPMARTFYNESKRVDNSLMKDILGVRLKYPDYKQALQDILEYEKAYKPQKSGS